MNTVDPCSLLDYCPIDAPASIERHNSKYLLLLGNRILAKDRTVLEPVPNPLNPFGDTEPSGSIGFLSFVPEPAYFKGAFSIYTLGVEKGRNGSPNYQTKGYGGMMIDWCERAAKRLDLPYVVHTNVMNDRLIEMLERRKYQFDIGTGFFPMYYKKIGPVHRARKSNSSFSLDDIPGIKFVRSILE